MSLVVIETGVANMASVVAALRRQGLDPVLSQAADVVWRADRVVLPGVGTFAEGMKALGSANLVEPLKERIAQGRSTLGICLGLQLFAESSEESPGVQGLGILSAQVTSFPAELVVPQFGWNRVTSGAVCAGDGGYAYFANSYRIETTPDTWQVSTTMYGGPFSSMVQRGSVVGCQFHPELSGEYGAAAIQRWLEMEVSPC